MPWTTFAWFLLKPIGLLTERDLDALAFGVLRSRLLAIGHRRLRPGLGSLRLRPCRAGAAPIADRAARSSAWNVARTTLCGLAEPIDLVSTFEMPQDSTTARTRRRR